MHRNWRDKSSPTLLQRTTTTVLLARYQGSLVVQDRGLLASTPALFTPFPVWTPSLPSTNANTTPIKFFASASPVLGPEVDRVWSTDRGQDQSRRVTNPGCAMVGRVANAVSSDTLYAFITHYPSRVGCTHLEWKGSWQGKDTLASTFRIACMQLFGGSTDQVGL